METKKCPSCGKTVLAISKTCKHCGKSLEAKQTVREEPVSKATIQTEQPFVVEQQEPVAQQSTYIPQEQTVKRGMEIKWWMWVICGILLIWKPIVGIFAPIGLAIYAVSRRNKG
jgi:uncharacterized membrane protein YvbJ